ncbi:nuclear transcription factor Y subunit A-3 isoform X1 [Neltuma alba]|uniref:nuclear transcription factor Y subunit A-3 isoform X1 n=2 Tax=Neltuma alba TaxID=207710 RepID=UPI0010A4C750|nr:nuclear transcription factor Y subunit A-3-like isoform X1 [Prosopis alba]XP_028753597.1 nuclear transcription factor Y subunit A-3-like isoform X1 [Prosopis alba]XP_028753598.1 nuclear transcription factor Y subunit A-3-like isoform X1 [Prosopis alba]
MKPFLSLNHTDTDVNCSHLDSSHSMARVPYPYGDPFYGGSLVSYGSQAINQPQIVPQLLGLTSTRVALPLDLAEDGPIYVNAKQYHGILRRRQSRAKLEAQNKLVKSRKPYLHESRHRHALNRVRGSGGRFLSTRQLQQSNVQVVTSANSGSDSVNLYQKKDISEVEIRPLRTGTGENASSISTCSDMTSGSSNNVNFRQPECKFLGNSTNMGSASQFSGGLTFGGTQQRAPIVR